MGEEVAQGRTELGAELEFEPICCLKPRLGTGRKCPVSSTGATSAKPSILVLSWEVGRVTWGSKVYLPKLVPPPLGTCPLGILWFCRPDQGLSQAELPPDRSREPVAV